MPPETDGLTWRHVDVFADAPFTGNGLTVFPDAGALSPETMQRVTQEMRQFESIYLIPKGDRIAARIFTEQEELDFAGHPVLGAAAVLFEAEGRKEESGNVVLHLNSGPLPVRVEAVNGHYRAEMDQGEAHFLGEADATTLARVVEALSLTAQELRTDLPAAIVSTGLPYLVLPVTPQGLAQARIRVEDFEARLSEVDAKFIYVLDPAAREGRTWSNDGTIEDVATGSAAGPAAAYLRRHANVGEMQFEIAQGRFVGRLSRLAVRFDPAGHIHVGGGVVPIARGRMDG